VLSSNDYRALVNSCANIFISNIPQLAVQQQDEARRLVTLVDILYEAHTVTPGAVRLCVSADVKPQEVFLPLLAAAARQGINPNLGRAPEMRLDVKQLLQVTTKHLVLTAANALPFVAHSHQ
jgi:cell division protein ZapE